jgi:hypothetical protein
LEDLIEFAEISLRVLLNLLRLLQQLLHLCGTTARDS